MFNEDQRRKLLAAAERCFVEYGVDPDLLAMQQLLIGMQHVLMHHPAKRAFTQLDSARELIEEAAPWVKYSQEMIQQERERLHGRIPEYEPDDSGGDEFD